MTPLLLTLGGVIALGDWAAVALRLFRLEYLLKPLTLALLLAAAATADLGPARPWVLAALAFCLAGDIALLVSGEDAADPPFLAGLGAFLLGHICYGVAFARVGLHGWDLLAGALVVGGIAALALPAILRGAARTAGPGFAGVVGAYAGVLGAMAVLAVGTGIVASAIGGVLFVGSDTLIARERFVGRIPHGEVLAIATYHLAQFLIVIGLIEHF